MSGQDGPNQLFRPSEHVGCLSLCDGVKEGPRDVAAPASRRPERAPLGIGEIRKRLIDSGRGQARVVEFMPAHDASGWAKRAITNKARFPIAEVQLALGKACCVTEKSRHGMANAAGVLNRFAEHHIAPTLPVNWARAGKSREPRTETLRGC